MKRIIFLAVAFLLGVAVSAPSPALAAEGPIKIGVLLPFTGVGAYGAEQCRLGFEMGLGESSYQAAGRKIELIVEDTAGEPPVTVSKARKLIEKDHVDIFYGPWFEHTALALKGVVSHWGRPVIFPMAATLKRTKEIPNSFNFSYTVQNITAPFAKYAYEKLGYKRAILAGSDYAWGRACVDAFAEGFKRAGGTIVEDVYVPLGTMDMSPYLDKIRARASDADFLWDFVIVADGVRFHRQFFESGLQKSLKRFSTGDVMTTTLLGETGLACVGSYAGYSWLPEVDIPASKKFITNFEKKYPGKAADWFAASGYEGAKIILTVLENIKGKVEDKKGLVKAMATVVVQPENNIYRQGKLTFDPKYRAPIVDDYVAKIVEENGKAKRQVIDVIKNVPPMVLPGFKE
jgi:branched-chain amino acid transport system substrate-binding protein